MKAQIAQAFEERLAPLTKRIENLEQWYSVKGVDAIIERSAEEDDITRQLHALMNLAAQAGNVFSRTVQKKLQSLETRLALLPSAPRIEVIQLAQSILALNPVILVTDDIVSKQQRPVLTRIFLMDPSQPLCFDYQFPSSLYEDAGLLTTHGETASSDAHLLLASLKQEWTRLQNAIQGRYVIAFDLPLLQIQFAITARMYGLPTPVVIGHSLLDLLLKYARVKELIDGNGDENTPPFSDAELCNVFAKEDVTPLFHPDSGPADQRAVRLLHALQAMANGTLSLQEPLPLSTLLQLTHPFSGTGLPLL